MIRPALLAAIAPLLIAAAPSPTDQAAVTASLAAIYRPYSSDALQPAVWDRPIFTAQIRRLIARWKLSMPKDEPDNLNDGDWLCQCQDWDARGFRAVPGTFRLWTPGRIEVDVAINLGHGAPRQAKFLFAREGRQWRIANLVAEGFPTGLVQALIETITENEARPK